MSEIIEFLSQNKKTAMIALVAGILVAIIVAIAYVFSNPKKDEE